MALFQHGAVSLWPCVGIVLCQHGTVLASLCHHGPMSAGAVSSWHFIGIVLCRHGPVSAGGVST